MHFDSLQLSICCKIILCVNTNQPTTTWNVIFLLFKCWCNICHFPVFLLGGGNEKCMMFLKTLYPFLSLNKNHLHCPKDFVDGFLSQKAALVFIDSTKILFFFCRLFSFQISTHKCYFISVMFFLLFIMYSFAYIAISISLHYII